MKRSISAIALAAALLMPQSAGADSNAWVAVTDGVSDKIKVYDPVVYNWNTLPAQRWEWKPNAAAGYSSAEIAAWDGAADVKLRDSGFWGGQVMATVSGAGLATVAAYPGGKELWSVVQGGTGTVNLHSIEVLPTGDVATVGSVEGKVRLYGVSHGIATPITYDLPDAHGVHWDDTRDVLWAVGKFTLVGLHVNYVNGVPEFSEFRKVPIPLTNGEIPYGHDVWPVYGNTDRLWIAVNWRVWQYDIAQNSWDDSYVGASVLHDSGQMVKSVGNVPSGQIVYTFPKTGWVTDTVSFTNPTATRPVTGAQIYKARPWIPGYDGTSGTAQDNLALKSSPSSSSTYESSTWGRAKAVDGQSGSVAGSYGFSSGVGKTTNHTEWFATGFTSPQAFNTVVIYPRSDSGYVGAGFPIDFKIQVWNGSAWLDRVTVTGYPQPGNAPQTFSLGTTDWSTAIRIYATKIPKVGPTDYLMQFAEVEVLNQ
ncbi:DUF6528 family protein [Paenibacillus flagellatus]|uniref:F5/8 type C domain-containing protein n=1 Tax=Paenibacillus flagellatus TaxID=2211139 RepID=A0A2V5KUQ5_9BACL|nr:DUF6528 family protein [Paenibacillus flagellatus]PYI53156.1 hypothetical protein DLM86_19405 [Paenibacillus flagellatus]